MEDRKLIIHVSKDVSDEDAIRHIEEVIKYNKTQAKGTAYRYVNNFNSGIKVIASKQPYGHKFHVGRWDK